MKPKISVVVAAFNEEKLLPLCLKSLLNQNYPRDCYEIIVVDNGSTDKTAQIAKSFGVTVFTYSDIKKCSAARQFGTTKANAPIIAFTDADSQVSPDWLTTIETLFKDSNLICVGGKILPDKNSFSSYCIYTFYNIFFLLNQYLYKTLLWGPNFAVRKSAFDKIGGFNTSLSTSDDWDLVLRLQKEFGKKRVRYVKNMSVYASARKLTNIGVFLKYAWDGIHNYTSVVLLGTTRSNEIENVR